MPSYSAERASMDSQPIVVLTDTTGRRVKIACHGAALLSLEARRHGTPYNFAWGYADAAEILAHEGSHFAIMAPFPGRIGDARYTFDDHDYDLLPGATGDARQIRHGFVRGADFTITALRADAAAARVTLVSHAIRPRPGYPFAIDLALDFTLDAAGLALNARMHNVGEHAAPCYFGWHAYFRVGESKLDDWTLQVPAHTTVRTSEDLIVLPGKDAYVAIEDAPALDFRQPRPIGNAILDSAFTHLVADQDARIRTYLADPASGNQLAIWQQGGVMHAFTSDTLTTGARSAIALEPMECLANAFTRPDCWDAIRLAPGAERSWRCGIELM